MTPEQQLADIAVLDRRIAGEHAPPQPASASRQALVDRLSDALVALNNAKPRLPTKDEIAEVLTRGLTTTTSYMMPDANAAPLAVDKIAKDAGFPLDGFAVVAVRAAEGQETPEA